MLCVIAGPMEVVLSFSVVNNLSRVLATYRVQEYRKNYLHKQYIGMSADFHNDRKNGRRD